jgi:hypothetical protein
MIMAAVWPLDLRVSEKLVLLALADNANDEGYCWPLVSTLMAKCSLCERAVQQALATLVAAAHITIHRRHGRSNYFRVHPSKSCTPQEMHPASSAPTPASDAPHPPQTMHPPPASGAPITIIEPSSESSRNQKTVAKARDDGPVNRVFDHWRSEYRHPKASLDPKRRRAIQRALESYDEPSLCTAISGYKLSPHHMGQNDQRTVYDDISLFLRDAEHVERGMNFARAPPVRAMSAVEIAQQNLRKPLGATNGSVVAEQDGSGESRLVPLNGMLR